MLLLFVCLKIGSSHSLACELDLPAIGLRTQIQEAVYAERPVEDQLPLAGVRAHHGVATLRREELDVHVENRPHQEISRMTSSMKSLTRHGT